MEGITPTITSTSTISQNSYLPHLSQVWTLESMPVDGGEGPPTNQRKTLERSFSDIPDLYFLGMRELFLDSGSLHIH